MPGPPGHRVEVGAGHHHAAAAPGRSRRSRSGCCRAPVVAFTDSCTRSPSRAGDLPAHQHHRQPEPGHRQRRAGHAAARARRSATTTALAPARRALTVLRQRKQVPKPVNATSPGLSSSKSAGSQPSSTARSVPSARPADGVARHAEAACGATGVLVQGQAGRRALAPSGHRHLLDLDAPAGAAQDAASRRRPRRRSPACRPCARRRFRPRSAGGRSDERRGRACAIGRGGGGGFEPPSSVESQPAKTTTASRASANRAAMRPTLGHRVPAASLRVALNSSN